MECSPTSVTITEVRQFFCLRDPFRAVMPINVHGYLWVP